MTTNCADVKLPVRYGKVALLAVTTHHEGLHQFTFANDKYAEAFCSSQRLGVIRRAAGLGAKHSGHRFDGIALAESRLFKIGVPAALSVTTSRYAILLKFTSDSGEAAGFVR